MGLFDKFKKDKAPDAIKTLDMRGHTNGKTDKVSRSFQQMNAAKYAPMLNAPWTTANVQTTNIILNDSQGLVIADILRQPHSHKGSQLICSLPDNVLSDLLQYIDKTIADIESTTSNSVSSHITIGYLEDWYEVIMEEQAARDAKAKRQDPWLTGYGDVF